jgi:hypothetical protein
MNAATRAPRAGTAGGENRGSALLLEVRIVEQRPRINRPSFLPRAERAEGGNPLHVGRGLTGIDFRGIGG